MKYNNRNYPHPVLGILDDYKHSGISVELSVNSNKENIQITPIFNVRNDEIKTLLRNDCANYVSHVYCRGTMFRETFSSKKPLDEPILIPASKVSGEVEVDFFVTANNSVNDFYSSDFNPDYIGAKFSFQDADVIAYGGKAKFFANKTYDELKSISSLMNIDCSGESDKPMYLDFSGARITIMLCIEDYNLYRLAKNNKANFGIILMGMVLPALIESLNYLDNEESQEFKDRPWFTVLRELKDNSKNYSDPFRIAQMILDKPLKRCLVSLTEDEAYE